MPKTIEMDDRGRLSLAKFLPPEQRKSQTFIIETTPTGGFILEPAIVRSALEDSLLRDACFMTAFNEAKNAPSYTYDWRS